MRLAAGAGTLVLLCPVAAAAHVAIPGFGGFEGGLLHPMLVLPRALALMALGLLMGLQPMRSTLLLIAAFLVGMVAAFGLVSHAYATDRAELAVLTIAMLTGFGLAAFPWIPLAPATLLTALAGGAILLDSVPAVPSVRETLLALSGTALAATMMLSLVAFTSAALPAFWARIGVRIAGSWIAASTMLVLGWRLAKL